MSYIIVAKPDDHKRLFQRVSELDAQGGVSNLTLTDDKGRIHRYRWVNQVPLNGSKGVDDINFFQYELVSKDKVTYKNSWVTDITIDEHNIVDYVKGGQARWKIENETFNTLKNRGIISNTTMVTVAGTFH